MEPFYKQIFIILFQRLQNARTVKFVCGLLVLVSQMAASLGPDNVIALIDSIQPKYGLHICVCMFVCLYVRMYVCLLHSLMTFSFIPFQSIWNGNTVSLLSRPSKSEWGHRTQSMRCGDGRSSHTLLCYDDHLC